MVDSRTPEQRRRIMQAVGTKHTKPEWVVRRLLHGLGYRYRLHCKNLPGKPDIAFPGRKKAIFVHGCFWHGHECPKGRAPKSKLEYWGPKLAANKARDARKEAELRELGWQTLAVWQCELGGRDALKATLTDFLGPPKNDRHIEGNGIRSLANTEIAA